MAIINLDGMWPDDLREWAERQGGANTTGAVRTLVNYALAKADAMEARVAGRINDALRLEARCDALYDSLPARCRW